MYPLQLMYLYVCQFIYACSCRLSKLLSRVSTIGILWSTSLLGEILFEYKKNMADTLPGSGPVSNKAQKSFSKT